MHIYYQNLMTHHRLESNTCSLAREVRRRESLNFLEDPVRSLPTFPDGPRTSLTRGLGEDRRASVQDTKFLAGSLAMPTVFEHSCRSRDPSRTCGDPIADPETLLKDPQGVQAPPLAHELPKIMKNSKEVSSFGRKRNHVRQIPPAKQKTIKQCKAVLGTLLGRLRKTSKKHPQNVLFCFARNRNLWGRPLTNLPWGGA
jgi:hypothetical protein